MQFGIAVFWGLTDIRYLTPILGLFVILISAAIIQFFRKSKLYKIIGLFLIILTIYIAAPKLINNFTSSLESKKKIDFTAVNVVVSKVMEIKSTEKFLDYNFFRIVTYRNGSKFGRLEGVFWAALEKTLNQKFVSVNENEKDISKNTFYDINNYYETNDDKYYFVVCYEYKNIEDINKRCLNYFLGENKNFSIINAIYQGVVQENISIYVAKRNN